MSSPAAADDRKRRPDPLLPLRDRAMADGATREDGAVYQEAAINHAASVARNYKRDVFYVDEVDAELIAERAWAKGVASYGALLKDADSVSAVLTMLAWQGVVDLHRKGSVSFRDRRRSLDLPVAADSDALSLEFSTSGAQVGGDESVKNEDDVFETVVQGEAMAEASGRLAGLREEMRQPGKCPFHMESGCPHGDRVFDFLATYLAAGQLLSVAELGTLRETDDATALPGTRDRRVAERIQRVAQAEGLLSAEEFERRLVEEGRKLSYPVAYRDGSRGRAAAGARTLSTADQSLNRHFRHCLRWWSYRAFAGTTADATLPGQLRLRMPLIDLLRLKPNGNWDSSACPKEGAAHMLATDPVFGRLLLWLDAANRKPYGSGTYKNIHDSLEGRAS